MGPLGSHAIPSANDAGLENVLAGGDLVQGLFLNLSLGLL